MGKYDDYDWEELPANIKAAGKSMTLERTYAILDIITSFISLNLLMSINLTSYCCLLFHHCVLDH